MAGLPSDTYHRIALSAVPLTGDDDWRDPAFLESLIRRVERHEQRPQKQPLSVWLAR